MTTQHEPPLAAVNPDPHNPFEVLILAVVINAGVQYLLGNVPTSVAEVFPRAAIVVFAVGHVVGGVFALGGLLRRHILVQQLGLGIVAAAVMLYPVALLLEVGAPGYAPAANAVAVMVASALKYGQLQRKINAAARFARDHLT